MSLITAAEAKALATPNISEQFKAYLGELNTAICTAANGQLKNIDIRVPLALVSAVQTELYQSGYQVVPLIEKHTEDMNFFRVSWN